MTILSDLDITELNGSQDGAYLIVNEAIEVLSRFSAGRITIDFAADANLTLDTDAAAGTEQWRDKFITITDAGVVLTGGVDVIFPAKLGPEYIIKNSTVQTLTLKISGQSGVTIATTVIGRFYFDGIDIVTAP